MISDVPDIPLPPLREDLSLHEGTVGSDGSPSWHIYDSIRNRYFRIGWLAFQLLSRWSLGTVDTLIKHVNEETTGKIDRQDVEGLLKFLYANSLTVAPATGGSFAYLEQHKAGKKNWLLWLLSNYLFFRLPLVRPHLFLKRTLPLVEPFFSAKFRTLVFLLGAIGVYLVAREWDSFVNSFLYFFNFQGLLAYIAALVFIKILHELGHAYTATLYGARVSTMGVAFLVMFPVLYTDTSNAWRLKSRKQRLHIGIAGMMVEVMIACLATFVWAFLPDGMFRSMAFLLATSSWLLSLSINLNAFMRFDGYYILSDWWGIENLQDRSFQLGRWKLREILFDLNETVPESLSRGMTRKLIIYAWLTWLYRFFLFLGIALLVYLFFFKLLGIFLFFVEILWFILFPVYRELKVWWSMKSKIVKSIRSYISLLFLICLLSLSFIPWNTSIRLPAILETTENVLVYPPVSGQIKSIHVEEGQNLKKGDLLLSLYSPVLEEEMDKTLHEMENIELHLNRRAANPDDLANIHIILSRLEELRSKYEGQKKQKDLLDIYAPITGKLIDMENDLHVGRWLNSKSSLFNIIDENNQQIVGMLNESEIRRVGKRKTAVFYPDNPEIEKINALLVSIEDANIKSIKRPYFNANYGGDIAARKDKDGQFTPESGVYRIIFKPEIATKQNYVLKGVIHIDGEAKSFFTRIHESVTAILIRESGF